MKVVIMEDSSVDKTKLVGGTIIGLRNMRLMRDVFGDKNVQILPYSLHSIDTLKGKLLRKLFFFNAGMTIGQADNIARKMAKIKPDAVFVNTALYGLLVKKIKAKCPKTQIITFFHNVEYDFFCDLTKTKQRFLGSIIRRLVKWNEQKSVHVSNTLITLNKRDSNRLLELYGRGADLLLPTSFEDSYKPHPKVNSAAKTQLLFVGFNFYANLEGVTWFVDHVMPQLGGDFTLSIVGRGMESQKEGLQRSNVDVVGTVDDMAVWYAKSDIVVLPIFVGSGMKTKTAEAMMYGKPIVASRESFEGYEINDHSQIGAMCNTAEEFVTQIKTLAKDKQAIKTKGDNARSLFLKKHSYQTVLNTAIDFFNGKS